MDQLSVPELASWPCAGMWLDAEGRVAALNAECCQQLAISQQRALGSAFSELLTAPSRLLWNSALWPALQVRHKLDDATLAFDTPAGPWTATALLRMSPQGARAGFSVLLLPSSERLRVHEELRRARRSLDAIPGAVLQCQLAAHGQLQVSYASAGLLDLLATTPLQVTSDAGHFLDALQADSALRFVESLQAAVKGGSAGTPGPWRVLLRPRRQPARVLEWLAQPEPAASGPLRWHGVLQDVSERERLQSELREQVGTDELTHLPNRRGLLLQLQRLIDEGQPFALLFMDVDRFKQVNDSLGHEAGDELLREIASRLRQVLRPADRLLQLPGAAALAARLGGDEFVVLVQGLAERKAVAALAERLQSQLSQPFPLGRLLLQPGVSIGIVMGNRSSSAGQLMRDADTAMYEAKRAGRGRFVHFEAEMHTRAASALSMEADLRAALQAAQLRVAYQPIVDIGSRQVFGLEALARWMHPQRGEVPAAQFIAVAEETGLIGPLGEQVLGMACQQFRAWREQGVAMPPRLSVNLSRAQLQDVRLPQRVQAILAASGLPAQALQFEVTETLAMQDDEARERLHELRAMGIRLALDDFGTGHSSLAALQQLPVQQLKIDRSFVRELETSAYHCALVQAAVQVAKALALEVVAEGVETDSQAHALQQLGCSRAQGYLFARPLESEQVPEFLATAVARQQARARPCPPAPPPS